MKNAEHFARVARDCHDEVTVLRERNERLRGALNAMLNEHCPLGQHENGEIEYCQKPACTDAQNVLQNPLA